MTFEEFKTRVREKAAIVGLVEGDGMQEPELGRIVNDTVQAIGAQLISQEAPFMIKKKLATWGMAKPADWHSFAGTYVMEEEGGKLYPRGTQYVRYYYYPAPLVATDDPIPFPDYVIPSMLSVAAILIMIRNHIDVAQHVQAAGPLVQGVVGQVAQQ